MRRPVALLCVALLAGAACSDDGPPDANEVDEVPRIPAQGADEQDRLEAAATRWAAAGIEDYEWTYARRCFCPQLTVTVQVADGEVVDQELHADEGAPLGGASEVTILTMPDMFEEVQEAIATADSFTVDYDADTGRVELLDVDPIENAIDDEYGYEVTGFARAGEEGPTTTVGPLGEEALTEAWACGWGFHISNAEQTVALMIDLTDAGTDPPQVTTLPDPRWQAEVLVGRDLFANWCDDVITPEEPEREVDDTWLVVAGTITIVDDVSALSTCEQPAVAHLSGLVAERPDGTRVPIDVRDVSNSCWGGGAG